MASVIKLLVPPKQAENSQTIQYTVGSATKTIIDKFTGTNTSGGVVTLSVNLIPSGDSAGDPNLIVQTIPLAAGETYTFPELLGHVITAGGTISTIASSATAITISVSGREIA